MSRAAHARHGVGYSYLAVSRCSKVVLKRNFYASGFFRRPIAPDWTTRLDPTLTRTYGVEEIHRGPFRRVANVD
jgi:hypothetical protein